MNIVTNRLRLLLLASLAVPAACFGLISWESRQRTLREADRQIAATVALMREQTARMLDTNELAIGQVDQMIAGMSWDEISGSRAVHELLRDLSDRLPQIENIAIVAPSGLVATSGRAFPAPAGDLSARDYFTALRARGDLGMYISGTYRAFATGRPQFAMVRRRSSRGGDFDGVIAAAGERQYFVDLYASFVDAPGTMVALMRDDGALLARYPVTDDPWLSAASPVLAAMKQGHLGRIVARSATDGVMRIGGLARVGQAPLIVYYGLSEADILAPWWQDMRRYGMLTLVASLSLAAMVWVAFQRAIHVGHAQAELKRLNAGLERRVTDRTAALTALTDQLRGEVAQRRRNEAAIRESEGLLRRIFDASPLGIMLCDTGARRMQTVNRAFCAFLGRPPEELLGHEANEFTHPDDRDKHAYLPGADPSAAGGWRTVEKRCLDRDGQVVWLRLHVELLEAQNGVEAQFLNIVENVTQQRRTEDLLRHSQKLEAIGQLTGGLAHDFNNLLAVIIGNLEHLFEMLAADDARTAVAEEALQAALHGAELTRSLLAFARRQPLQPEATDINLTIEGIVRLLARTLGEDISVSLDLSPQVWPVFVDRVQLETAIANLATNARDAMPRGGRILITSRNAQLDADYAATHAEVTPGDYALIEVTDTGGGMSAETLDRIFEPFFTTKKLGEGTGLGLSMVFGFMKQSGGHVSAYSELGLGTTLRLYIPQIAPYPAPEGDAMAMPMPMPAGDGRTILLVEDNVRLREINRRVLALGGYRVLEAADAHAALDLLRGDETIDLMLTDIVMPGEMSGYDLARTAAALRPGLKIVYTSGFPDVGLRDHAEAATAAHRLLSKPYRKEELFHILREVLDEE